MRKGPGKARSAPSRKPNPSARHATPNAAPNATPNAAPNATPKTTPNSSPNARPSQGTSATASTVPTRVTVRRAIEASAEELFDAWLDPESVAEWMRPNGIDRTSAVIDAHVGGTYEITMQRGAGPLLHKGVYQEIDRPRRLVFTWSAEGPLQHTSLVTVEFNERGGTTEVVVTHEQLPAADDVRPSVHTGWTQAIERLAKLMEGRKS
jgi:uncharacterized protein YndB with AHSA1/START domain